MTRNKSSHFTKIKIIYFRIVGKWTFSSQLWYCIFTQRLAYYTMYCIYTYTNKQFSKTLIWGSASPGTYIHNVLYIYVNGWPRKSPLPRKIPLRLAIIVKMIGKDSYALFSWKIYHTFMSSSIRYKIHKRFVRVRITTISQCSKKKKKLNTIFTKILKTGTFTYMDAICVAITELLMT